MNVYEMEGFMRGKGLPGDLLVGESNAAYLVRKFNESNAMKAERDAQQKRADALAVENAERGEIIERLIGIFTASGYHAIQNSYDPCSSLLFDAFQAIRQPATAAAVAEIKAQGLDELANACEGYAENHVYTFTKRHAEEFAAELREAK